MKKYIYTLIVLFLFFFQMVYALEAEYKTFGGRTISDSSTLGDYIAYYFNFFLVFATGAAILVIIFAGINYLISGDNFNKRLVAKKMIFNSFFGLLLAFGSIVILNTINPDSDDIIAPLDSQEYNEGIYLIKGGNKKIVNDNLAKVTEDYDSIEWISPPEDLLAVYVFDSPDYFGSSQEVLNGDGVNISANSSIWFLWTKPGSYILYNGIDFTKGSKNLPLSSTKDKVALAVDFFDDATQSIKINQRKNDTSIEYGAILFSEARYEGSCVWVMHDVPNLDEVLNDNENNPPIGIDKISSVKKITTSPAVGTAIIIYNRANCQNIEEDKSSKKCTINKTKENIKIDEECKDFVGEEVLSINFDSSNAGVLLKGSNDSCQYFEKLGGNECISLIKYGNIYDPDNKIYPKYLTLFSLNK